MRKLMFALAALVAAFLLPADAFAQAQGTQVFWNASRLDAASAVATSATSAATLTLTPQSGQSVYMSEIHVTNCAGASAVTAAAVTSVTTTNMNGAAWTVGSGVAAGLCQPEQVDTFGGSPLKAAAPGPVTIVLPTFATNQTVRVSGYWYSAP